MKIIVFRNVAPCSERNLEKLRGKLLLILAGNKLQRISNRTHGVTSNKRLTRVIFYRLLWKLEAHKHAHKDFYSSLSWAQKTGQTSKLAHDMEVEIYTSFKFMTGICRCVLTDNLENVATIPAEFPSPNSVRSFKEYNNHPLAHDTFDCTDDLDPRERPATSPLAL